MSISPFYAAALNHRCERTETKRRKLEGAAASPPLEGRAQLLGEMGGPSELPRSSNSCQFPSQSRASGVRAACAWMPTPPCVHCARYIFNTALRAWFGRPGGGHAAAVGGWAPTKHVKHPSRAGIACFLSPLRTRTYPGAPCRFRRSASSCRCAWYMDTRTLPIASRRTV